jgi:hypothetical protein
MLVKTDERVPLAQLLKFLELGEQLASQCARDQTVFAPEKEMKKFLSGQARQEEFHALSFKWAIGWLAPRHLGAAPFMKPFEEYRILLNDSIQRKDFIESLLAEQIILEGLGEMMLKKIEAGLIKRNAPFRRLRRILIHQEQAHHAFGLRILQRAIDRDETNIEQLRDRAQEYVGLADGMMTSVTDLFASIDEDPKEYIEDFHRHLPTWLDSYSQSGNQQPLINHFPKDHSYGKDGAGIGDLTIAIQDEKYV